MIIEVDSASAVPAFEQIRVQIERMVLSGVLPVGMRLPTIAQLSNDLGLSAGTVARAYRELEGGGLVTSRRRFGTVVAERMTAPSVSPGEIDRAVLDFVRDLRQLGASPDDAIRRFYALWKTV